jgi:DNA-binding GntR family transcriptional regulator
MGISWVKPVSAIPRQSLAAAVANKLREKIIRGELREGEQIRQDAIALEFQVSKIPVREALQRLEAEGLIKIVANRGAIVSALSADEIGEMFEVRAVLECHVLRHSIDHLTEEDFQRAERLLAEYEHMAEDTDVARWAEWNWNFHSAFYQRAKRPVFLALLKTLNNNCDRYTRMVLLVTGNIHFTGHTHRVLLEAIQTRDAEIATRALWEHMMDASGVLKEFIRNRPR